MHPRCRQVAPGLSFSTSTTGTLSSAACLQTGLPRRDLPARLGRQQLPLRVLQDLADAGEDLAAQLAVDEPMVERARELGRPAQRDLALVLPRDTATSFTERVTSTVTNSVTCGAVKALRTMAAAGLSDAPDRDPGGRRLLAYARYRGRLRGDRRVSQDEIDSALAVLHGAKPRRVRSASPTSELVAESMRSCEGPVTATELAGKLGISRPTAQRYLAELAAEGRLRVELRYGAAGRPEHLYYWRHS